MLALLLLACGGEDVETGETGDTGSGFVVQMSELKCADVEYDDTFQEWGWTLPDTDHVLDLVVCDTYDDGYQCRHSVSWSWHRDVHFFALDSDCSGQDDRIYQVFWI